MQCRHIIFDFDGVLVESNEIRFQGFADLFSDIHADALGRFMDFVKANGGLSRYAKIRHLYNHILRTPLTESEVNALANQYSRLVAQRVAEAPAVPGALEFLAANLDRFDFAIVSGSDQIELRQVCRIREIDTYFLAILGSPKEKKENILALLSKFSWNPERCLYVGDSWNDYEAAIAAEIAFVGRNSGLVNWEDRNQISISSLAELPAAIEELNHHQHGSSQIKGLSDTA